MTAKIETTGRKTTKKKSVSEHKFSTKNADNFTLQLKDIQKPIVTNIQRVCRVDRKSLNNLTFEFLEKEENN